jgi:hypothetical protein
VAAPTAGTRRLQRKSHSDRAIVGEIVPRPVSVAVSIGACNSFVGIERPATRQRGSTETSPVHTYTRVSFYRRINV